MWVSYIFMLNLRNANAECHCPLLIPMGTLSSSRNLPRLGEGTHVRFYDN